VRAAGREKWCGEVSVRRVSVWQQEGRRRAAAVHGGTCCIMVETLPWAAPCTGDEGCVCGLSGVQLGGIGRAAGALEAGSGGPRHRVQLPLL